MIFSVFTRSRRLCPVFLVLVFAQAIFGEIVFDNLITPQEANGKPLFTDYSGEFGDEIQLTGTSRTLTDFFFYYYGHFVPVGQEAVKVRFYQNDFPYVLPGGESAPAPGTLLYESDWRPISGQGYAKETISNPTFNGKPVILPDDFTWTVEFKGLTMTAGNEAGLIYYHPIAKGDSFDDYWQRKIDGTWTLLTLNPTRDGTNPKSNFGALIIAVPEPGVLAMGACAGIAALMASSFRRKARE